MVAGLFTFMNAMTLICGSKTLDLSRPAVMAIVNVTPDSFSDGGQLYSDEKVDLDKTLGAVESMLAEGADIIDIGGESTRPGASPVTTQQELDRVLPVIEAVKTRFDALISVDTSTAEVITAASAAGAHLINDVRALQREGALEAAVAASLPVCLMHMQNQPKSMQSNPTYKDVVTEVLDFLQQRKQACLTAGIASEQILLDPGFGFGKTLQHNLALCHALDRFVDTGQSLLLGVSRKTMIGQLLDSNFDDRLIGSVTMALLMAQSVAERRTQTGCSSGMILRVHDVCQTVEALTVWQRTMDFKEEINNL
jgi:dihydropteroate synthase